MALLGRPIPRMVALAGEATRGLGRVLEVAAGTGLVTPAIAAGAAEVIATDDSAEHRHVDRHGPGWEAEREGVAAEQGWPLYLRRFGELFQG